VTPLLIASAKPDYWSLYIYIAIYLHCHRHGCRVRAGACAAVALAGDHGNRARCVVDGPGSRSLPGRATRSPRIQRARGLRACRHIPGVAYGPPAAPGEIDRLSTLALSAYLLVSALLALVTRHDPVALTAFVVLTAATVAIAWRTEAATAVVPVAAILAAAVMAHWAVPENISALVMPSGLTAPSIPEPDRFAYGSHLLLAAGWSGMFGIAGFLAQGRAIRALAPTLWCASGVFVPLAMLVALYYRIAGLDQSLPFAGLALLLAAIYGVATETLVQRESRPGLPASTATRNGRTRGPRPRAHLCPGKRPAHYRARADRARRRLGCGETAAAMAALACRHYGRRRGGAHRL
jgi:uncharacterized membrane protein